MAVKCSRPVEPRAGVASLSERAIEAARFRRSDRLKRKFEFDRVLKERSVRVASAPFIALACPATRGNARLGLIVAKRHCARAVDRNRIKRLARETFRACRSRLPSLDIVIQLVRAPGEANVRDALDDIWKQLERRQGQPQ